MKKSKKFVKQLIEGYKRKVKMILGHTYKGHRNSPIIFILCTGRCGSTSIKDIFNQHPRFLAFHEDIKPVIKLSTKLAEHPECEKEIFTELNNLFANRIWEAKNGQIIVHSDHRLWNLVPYLSKYFPNAYFIHLIRNPFDSVKSFLLRDWYNDLNPKESLFDKYRLYGDVVRDLSQKDWQNLDQIDKCLWYWNYVNKHINKQLLTLDSSKHSHITLEKLDFSLNELLVSKFGIDKTFKFVPVIKNRSKKELNDGNVESLIRRKINNQSQNLFLEYYPEFK
jgi:hypothetical protein